MEGEHRKRLKKLKSNAIAPPPNDLIPKKKNIPLSEKIVKAVHEDSDDSIEDFITDRVEFDRNGPPISSEESAHSTDEENFIKKKKKVKESSSEESAHSSSQDEALDSIDSDNLIGEGETKEILVGKKALEEKRKQGLIPDVKKSILGKTKEEKKKKKKKKHEEDHVPKEKSKKHKDPKKYVQFSEFGEKDRKKAEMVTKILQRWWYALDD